MKSKTRPPSMRRLIDPPAARHHPLIVSIILVLTLIATPVHSQDSPITVIVNSTDISTDEVVVLTVTIVADSPEQPRPILPDLDGLAVVDLDLATDVRMIKNTIQTEVTYTYLLQPLRVGDQHVLLLGVRRQTHIPG